MKSEIKAIATRSPSIYYGFTGHENLGDEAIWQATDQQFRALALTKIRVTRFDFINQLLGKKHKKLMMLGGGTLIGDNAPNGANMFREQYALFSQHAKTKVAFGTGVGSIGEAAAAPAWLKQWHSLLTGFDYIGVRGMQSKEALATLGIDAEVIGDSACSWAVNKRQASKRQVMGVNIGAKKELLPSDKMAEYAQFIKNKGKEGWAVEFYIVNPSDESMTKAFAASCELSNVSFINIYSDTALYLQKVSSVEFFIGTRLHSVILAMCAGVPSIMLGYAPKAHDFMQSIEMDGFNLEVSLLTSEKLEQLSNELLSRKQDLSIDILARIGYYKDLQTERAKQIISNL